MTVDDTNTSPSFPECHGAPDRWQPTRAGLVNIWNYDDELLEFENGRLLLTGGNGAGKTMALELLLPFLLDGNPAPSRLSTAGGHDRGGLWERAAGTAGDQRRVGYLWVEFGRRGPDGHTAYFTCGDRLSFRASGKGGSHSYFTTTQRVGDGLRLLDDTRRPLTPDAFKAAIGEHGTVTEDRDAYCTAVRTTLYPDHNEEEYASLISSLLNVRQQSVTDDLNPRKLNALLTKGLPGLDDQAISATASVFENLDTRRDQLEEAQEAVAASSSISALATGYARGAVGYVAERTGAAQRELADRDRAHKKAQTAFDETTSALARAERDLTTVGSELNKSEAKHQTLLASPEGQRIDEIHRAEKEADRDREEATNSEAKAAEFAKGAETATKTATTRSEKAAEATLLLDASLAALTSACKEAGVVAPEAQDPSDRIRSCRTAAGYRSDAVTEVRALVEANQRALQNAAEKADTLHNAETVVDDLGVEVNACTDKLETQQAAWVSAVVAWSENVTELGAATDDPFHNDVRAAVTDFDTAAVVAATYQAGMRASRELSAAKQAATHAAAATNEELRGVEDAIDALSAEDHTVQPERHPWRNSHDPETPGAPLWQLLAPADDLDQDRLDGIEAALLGAGILDAWVTVSGTLPGHGDVLAHPTASVDGTSLASFLRVDLDAANTAGIDPGHVTDILNAIGFENDAAALSVAGDGTFMYGVAAGAVEVTGAKHIGAAARERARQAKLAALEEVRAELADRLTQENAAVAAFSDREHVLGRETEEVPSSEEMEYAAEKLDQAQSDLDDAQRRLTDASEAYADAEKHAATSEAHLSQVAGSHHLPTTSTSLDDIARALQSVENEARDAERNIERANNAQTAAETAAAAAATAQGHADDAEAKAAADRQRADNSRVRFETLDASHGDDAKAAAAKIKEVEQEKARLKAQHATLVDEKTSFARRQGTDEANLNQAVEAAAAARTDLKSMQAWFVAVLNSGLSADAGLNVSELDLASDGGLSEAVSVVRRTLPATSPEAIAAARDKLSKGQVEAQRRLGSQARLHSQPLPVPDDISPPIDLLSLEATMDALVVRIPEMADKFKLDYEEHEAKLTKSETELFTGVLAGGLRKHIASRYRAAVSLVDSMNAIISEIETTQGNVGVSLRWEVKDDGEDNATLKHITKLLLKSSHSDQESKDLQAFFKRRLDRIRDNDNDDHNASWEQDLRTLFDYRQWHEFKIMVRHHRFGETPVPITARKVSLSAGETALVTSLPLFAAVTSHYMPRDSDSPESQCPRLLLLDEVFPKNDAENKRKILRLLTTLDLDCMMTSDKDRCTYDTIDGIAIALIAKDGDRSYATRFVWNGVEQVQQDPKDLSGEPWQPSLH